MEISESTIKFIQQHAKDDINTLRLKYHGKSHDIVNYIEFALLQIEARRKTQKKLPTFLENKSFIFPDSLAAEQASNEVIARIHTSLVAGATSILDLTAGLGIDDMTFAKSGINVTSCELEASRCEALSHNSRIMGVSANMTIINCDSIEYLKQNPKDYDVIFSDPARRNDNAGRVHALSDCQPDIISSLPYILHCSPRLLVKSSPMLDLSMIRDSVPNLYHMYVLCYKGECKEVLIDIRRNSDCFNGVTVIDADNVRELSRFHTTFKDSERTSEASMCDRTKASDYSYLYEPNAGVMKTGSWTSLISKFAALQKADHNTHIFLSDAYYPDFPGRIMKIVSEPDKKDMKQLKGKKMNVVARNHPLSAHQISSKYSLSPGDRDFLYGFRYKGSPALLTTEYENLHNEE